MMRHLVLILLILAVFFIPWWLTIGLLLLATLFYRRFYAVLIPAVTLDVMHGGAALTSGPLVSATLIVSGALIALSFAERYLRDHVRA